ncbi:MAG: hypothetical protein CSA62_01610 [Planctomycetota bacterium]|nr:MAG: hypothetical protein CSA62_01610 [Planctomycetota bacterium]
MFSTKEFRAWAKKNVVLFASIMTRIQGRKEDDLLSKYGFRGFPSLALLDANGEMITKKVSRDLPSMKAIVHSAAKYAKLKAQVDAGEDVDKAEWLMARMGMGMLSVEEAKEAMAEIELSDAQADKMDTMLLALEIESMLQAARSRSPEAKSHPAKIYKMWKSNRRLPKGHGLEAFYMSMLFQEAEKQNDAEAWTAAFPFIERQLQSQLKRFESFRNRVREDQKDRLEKAIESMKNRLKALRKKAAQYK